MRLRSWFFATFVSSLAACAGDADGGLGDVTIPDGEVSVETSDGQGGGDADASDLALDTTAPDVQADATPDSAPDTTADTTPDATADTTPDSAPDATADTAIDLPPDATADSAADTDDDAPDTVTPPCIVDADCVPSGIIVAPNQCRVPVCVEGACTIGPPDCADGDPCTVDACDPFAGCVNTVWELELGASRYTWCPDALPQSDALAACLGRGEALAFVGSEAISGTLVPLLLDAGVNEAWVDAGSDATCGIPKRVAPQPCKTLQIGDEQICTAVAQCVDIFPFICELRCDDLDPCTEDVIDVDGTCSSRALFCDDGDACTTDSCLPDVGCVHDRPRGQCVDANPCTTDSCDPDTGACSNRPVRRPWDATHELLECPGQDTWEASRTWCAVNGGTLASPIDATQWATLAAFATSARVSASLWAPFQQVGGGANPWTWVDAAGSGEPAWCASQPDDASGSEDCGEWQPATQCAGDAVCAELRSFACEIDTSIP